MTYILVGLMYIAGQLQARIIEQPSRNSCEQAATAVRAQYPDATVFCAEVKGQPK